MSKRINIKDLFTAEELGGTTLDLRDATISIGTNRIDGGASRLDRLKINILNHFLPQQLKVRLTTPREALLKFIDARTDMKFSKLEDMLDELQHEIENIKYSHTGKKK